MKLIQQLQQLNLKGKTLPSLEDFIQLQADSVIPEKFDDAIATMCWNDIYNFKKLLEKPLEPWMFYPSAYKKGKWVPYPQFIGNRYKGNGILAIGATNNITKEFSEHLKGLEASQTAVVFKGWSAIQAYKTENTYTVVSDQHNVIHWSVNDVFVNGKICLNIKELIKRITVTIKD